MPVKPDSNTVLHQAIIAAADHAEGMIGLAVSGGGDSVAMMHLAARKIAPTRLRVFTVNHNLRAEAQAEIALVRAQAAQLGLPHDVVNWHWDETGNLQAQARAGRWDALCNLAGARQVGTIWMAHTEDDQIETFLMRLARGSGIDGLSGMTGLSQRDGMTLCRPLLAVKRATLRDWLTQNKVLWRDDPSNEDTRFDRVRARQMADHLADLGLTPKRILQTVDHVQAARLSLRDAGHLFIAAHYVQDQGDLVLKPPAVDLTKADTPRRALASAVQWIGGGAHKPRFAQLSDAANRAANGQKVTFAGCMFSPESDGTVRLAREAHATPQIDATSGVIWDGRWRVTGPKVAKVTIKALGDAISFCPAWREAGLPRASLLASPAIWQGDVLIAAPLAGLSQGWSVHIVADFHSWAFAIED